MKQPAIILIVDDAVANRETLRELLNADNFQLVEAADGPTALRLAAETPPDLVLLDVMMPGMDGYEVCRRLRADARLAEMPIIMVTALDDQASRLAGIEAGADDFITKPYNRVELRARVRTISRLNRYRRLLETQEGLRESEARFIKMAESSNDMFWFVATNPERITFLSPAVERIWGRTAAQYYEDARLWTEAIHPDDRPRVRAAYEALISGRAAQYKEEYRVVQPDGTVHWVLVTGMPIHDACGVTVGAGGLARDITERKQAEATLLREQILFTDLTNTIPDHIYFKDRQSRFIRINAAMARLFGLRDAAEAVGKTDFEMFSEDHARQAYGDEQRIMESGEPMVDFEEKETWPDGHITWVSTTKAPLRDPQGCVTGLVGVSRDITLRKEAEEQLLRAQRLENIGMLAVGIAHDFNNALAPIVMVGPLLRQHVGSPEGRHFIDIMEKSAQRGAALVRQLFSFNRGVGGERHLLQVRHVLREVGELADVTFGKSIRVETVLPGNLWPIQANANQIHQVLLNLCVNARDAMPQGGDLTLTAANRTLDAAEAAQIPDARPGDFVTIEVRDTGTGIPAAVLARIWEPFYTTKAEGKGTGLGLSTVRGILHQHDGFVTVQTREDHGTTFTAYVPAVVGATGGEAGPRAVQPARGEGELILVVDDEESVRLLAAQILNNHCYQTVTACDGADAIAVFAPRAEEVRLLLTDMQMPILGGPALAAALRRLRPGLPIVSMSGVESLSGAVVRELTTSHIAKPFQAETLLSIVRSTLDANRPPAESPSAA